MATRELVVRLRSLHPHQQRAKDSRAKRKILKAGRRGGKTTYAADEAVDHFLDGRRVLYAVPTMEQMDTFWREVKAALAELLDAGLYYKNETLHIIERAGTEQRIRAKTAYNADTLRGDYADLLILDEWQLMDEMAWEEVGAPMLLDNNGDAIFIFTPPSLHSRSVTKARDPRHASKMFGRAREDPTGRWATFHFTSHDNPYISTEALRLISEDMSALAVRQEIMAEDVDEIAGAMWTRDLIERTRVKEVGERPIVGIGVDPPGSSVTECGIIVGTLAHGHSYIIGDYSIKGSPRTWAGRVLDAYVDFGADCVLAETNFGGAMVEETLQVEAAARGIRIRYKPVHATRGKAIRAEPVVAKFEHGQAHIVGSLPELEDELVSWVPGVSSSPNRLDAMVWVVTGLGPPPPPMTMAAPSLRRVVTALNEEY
jgi:hypothetical protein